MTAGLYWSRRGIEERSFTFSTTMPTVVVSPGFREIVAGSNRRVADLPGVTGFTVGEVTDGGTVPTTGTPCGGTADCLSCVAGGGTGIDGVDASSTKCTCGF